VVVCVVGGESTLNPSKNNKKKKILFVDDDLDTTWLSKRVLERNGFEVQTFESHRQYTYSIINPYTITL
jgi:DNA-binding NtrC family response regulator